MAASASIHILIDPYIFIVPSHLDQESGLAYIESLITWCRAFRKLRHYCSTSRAALNEIYLLGRFPTLDQLRIVLADNPTYSVNDLRNVLRVLADLEPYLESVTRITDIALSDGGTLAPSEFLDRLPQPIARALFGTLAIACLARSLHWKIGRLFFGTSRGSAGGSAISVAARCEMYCVAPNEIVERTEEIRGGLEVVTSTMEVYKSLEVVHVYADPPVATLVAALRSDPLTAADVLRAPVRASERFLPSIEVRAIHRTPLIERVYTLAAMAAAGRLSEIAGAKLHAVREGPAADSPQLTREDGAKLWRCMLSREGAGYRLHFWTLPGGGIELDEIMPESEV